MKKYTYIQYILAAVLSLMGTIHLRAQQESLITQFMHNKMFFTPAYAGSEEGPCASALYRKQWIGIEGSPELQLVSFHLPLFQQRVGLGANISRHAIGVTRQITAELAYAYRIPVARGYLSAGLSGSVRYFSEDLSDPRVKPLQDINQDQAIALGQQSRYIPNFGVGLYYQAREWYAGAGMPRLIESDIDFGAGGSAVSRERRLFYLMGGYRFALSPYVAFHPQIMMRYGQGIPLDGDLHLGLEMNDQFLAGVSYRMGGHIRNGGGESLDLMIGFRLKKQLLISAAYDISLTKIRTYQNGTVEVMLQYCFGKAGSSQIDNPRFFD